MLACCKTLGHHFRMLQPGPVHHIAISNFLSKLTKSEEPYKYSLLGTSSQK